MGARRTLKKVFHVLKSVQPYLSSLLSSRSHLIRLDFTGTAPVQIPFGGPLLVSSERGGSSKAWLRNH